MKVTVTIDRIEGGLAVLEVGEAFVEWPVSALPANAREGSVLDVCFELSDTVQSRLEEGQARLEGLRERGPSDDEIDL